MTTLVPISDANGYFRQVPWQAGSVKYPGLNLGSKTWGNTVTRQANDIQPAAQVRVRIFLQLTSGTLTLNAMVSPTGTSSFGSPTATTGAISDTNLHCIEFVTTTTNPVVSLQGISGSAAVINRAEMTLANVYPAGGGYHEADASINGLGVTQTAYDYVLAT